MRFSLKNIRYWLISFNLKGFTFLLCIVLYSCYEETSIPVEAKFTTGFVNNDESVPVQVSIKNLTENADAYNWTFEGGIPNTSNDENPGTITYNEPGTYTISLYATNSDGEQGEFTKEITIYDAININYSVEILESAFPPVELNINNSTTGVGMEYFWTFEGGAPTEFEGKDPPNVIFNEPGPHNINLKVSNGFEFFEKDTVITVLPNIIANFQYSVNFFDDDYQAPVTINCSNLSISATSYEWTFEGGTPAFSTNENPTVTFQNAGTYTITLVADNGKSTSNHQQTISILPDTNLRVFNDIKFGINNAHNLSLIPAFFSTVKRESYFSNQLNNENSPFVDIAFSGLNSAFNINQFISPQQVQNFGFPTINNASTTNFINSQEICNCGGLSVTAFNNMSNDLPLQNITITNSPAAIQAFNSNMVPRIVLFQTQDGRKGAIKIKEFVANGNSSYINTDIKVQKLP